MSRHIQRITVQQPASATIPDKPDSGYLPLNYPNLQLFPDILTRFSDPGSALKAFDGKVGALLENNCLVTSPNMQVLFDPPSPSRCVRLRRHLHFSHDDPLFYPQPYNEQYPHLPFIRVPSADANHRFAIAWVQPSDDHFDDSAEDILAGGGILNNDFYLRLKGLAEFILNDMTSLTTESDVYVQQGALQISRMLELLQIAAFKEDIFFRVAFLQRNLLELDARIQFLKLQEQHSSLESRQTSVPQCLDVIGAFADNFFTLAALYENGIPVWFVRRVEDTPDARIDSTAPVIAEDRFQCFTLPSGFRVDGSDAEPPHKVVWEGLPNKTERYSAMSAYLHSLLSPPSLFGSVKILGLPPAKRVGHISGSVRDILEPVRDVLVPRDVVVRPHDGLVPIRDVLEPVRHISRPVHSKFGSSSSLRLISNARSTPYLKRKPKQQNPVVEKNSGLLTANANWSQALSIHADYNASARSPQNVASGYFLPPPRLLDGPSSTKSQAFYYRAWLKARPLILQSLNGLTKPLNLSAKHWRSFLDVAGGHPLGDVEKSRNAPSRARMRTTLEDLISRSRVQFDLNNLMPQIEEFNGQLVDCRSEPPPTEIAARILMEIYELSFRQDLIALDRSVDQSGQSLIERNALLDRCWEGSRNEVDFAKGEGLSASDILKRAPYIGALHELMLTWKGNKPDALHYPFPTNIHAHNYTNILEDIEYSLAQFYVESFLSVFWRLPSVPHNIIFK
ncbi:hypothetical protein EV360DRAFT_85739 [Lentinula raphanica]|nr:hypothetical protein EV360DRAFT_85739 [Lentinula raphanica]